jgi:hypothetical protein
MDIFVNVTNTGAANVAVSNGSTVNATVGSGGVVSVALGTISPGNATVVSGTLTINSTTTLAAGQSAYVKNDAGTAYAAKLDIGIPAGPATLVSVGNTTTLAAGSNATVTGNVSGSNLTLAFGIPRGVTPSIAIGNVTTSAAGSSASVVATTTNSGANVTLDLTIPRGDPGTSGSNGTNGTTTTLSDATPSNLGTAAAGSSNLAARADHVHLLPSLSTLGAAAAAHGHNYVTSLNNLTGGLTLAAGGNVTITSANSTLTIAASGGLGENDSLDGGFYVGQILGGIAFSTQPQSVTINVSAPSVAFANVTPNVTLNSSRTAGVSSFQSNLFSTSVASSANGSTVNIYSSADNGSSWSTLIAFGEVYNANAASAMTFASNGSRTVFTTGVNTYSSYGNGMPLDHAWGRYSDSLNLASSVGIPGFTVHAVAWMPSANLFVASGLSYFNEGTSYGGVVLSSADGVNWTVRVNGGSPTGYGSLFVIGGRAVALRNGTNSEQAHFSVDGTNWSSVSISSTITDAAASSSRIVTVNGSTSSRYTADGSTWSTGTLPAACDRIDYAAGLFWAFRSGTTSSDICTSGDGITWTLRDAGVARKYFCVAAAANSGVALILSDSTARSGTLTTVSGSANLTVFAAADGGNPVAYQWQRSIDAGTTWGNVTNATSTTLSLVNLTQSDSGTRYRAAASATGAASVTSQSATLTVTG